MLPEGIERRMIGRNWPAFPCSSERLQSGIRVVLAPMTFGTGTNKTTDCLRNIELRQLESNTLFGVPFDTLVIGLAVLISLPDNTALPDLTDHRRGALNSPESLLHFGSAGRRAPTAFAHQLRSTQPENSPPAPNFTPNSGPTTLRRSFTLGPPELPPH